MNNAKDYLKGTRLKVLVYGLTGSGKSSALLSHPGKKFVYIFDPAGLETFAGHDVDYEMFVPEMQVMAKSKLGSKSKAAELLRPDPKTYLRFEKDFEDKAGSGFFKAYDLIGFESLTTLLPMIMWYILDSQGRGNSAPEIADYYYRADGIANIVRLAASIASVVFFSAHSETSKDEVSGRIENNLFLPAALKANLPLLFSEVVHTTVEPDKEGNVLYLMQMKPDKRSPLVRTSLSNVKPFEDVTIDWDKPVAGQGFFSLYHTAVEQGAVKPVDDTTLKMG
jgi:GTPase SAR1 family protein